MIKIHGRITRDFKEISRLKKLEGKLYRTDCYQLDSFDEAFVKNLVKREITDVEIFNPSLSYPPHIDDVNFPSYFIALEDGVFYYDGVNYVITPFILHEFNSKLYHNSNFKSLMLS